MGLVSTCAFSFMSKYLHQSCVPKPMTRLDINDNNQSSNNLNIYHKQVHQLCKKIVKITHHNNLSKQPITTTCLINLINQIRSNHQDQSPRQLSTICTISPRCASTKHKTTTHNHHQDQYALLIIYPRKVCYIIHKPCVNNTTIKCLQPCTNHASTTHQL
jgi:hypothetical protein